MTPEGKLQGEILKALKDIPGVRMFRVNTGQRGRMNIGPPKGTPDIIGYCGRYFLGLECKAGDGIKDKTSKTYLAQLEWRKRALLDGASVFVVTSVHEAVAFATLLRNMHVEEES